MYKKLKARKYAFLLFSLSLLLFGELFFPYSSSSYGHPFLLLQSVFAGVVLFSDNKKWKSILVTLFIAIVCFEIGSFAYEWQAGRIVNRLLYMIYFVTISLKVYTDIFKNRNINIEMIFAVFCGFIMLGMLGGLFFLTIEIATPNSFSNLINAVEKHQDLQYFGFITTLTIGYGDIVPLTVLARKATLLMGLLGNFYTVFVMGIVIGKYLQFKK